MAGLALEDMARARVRYRPSAHVAAFPTAEYLRHWDGHNAERLRRAALSGAIPQAQELLALADLIDSDEVQVPTSPVPQTMASLRFRYDLADRVCGHAWEMFDDLTEPAHFFTAIPSYGEVGIGDLAAFRPEMMVERLRAELNAHGALGSDGFLLAVLEAEYQSRTEVFRFHWHGAASGGKLQALRNFRADPAKNKRGVAAYYSPRRSPGEPKREVPYRLSIARDPLYNLPRPLTYAMKPWYARWVSEEGVRGRRRRLPDGALVATLLWHHRYSLSDISLRMGIRPARDGFIIFNSTRMKGGGA